MRKSILRAQVLAVCGKGVVFHASAVLYRGKGVLFLAPSGGGKSTAAATLGNEGLVILGDDSTIVCKGTDDAWRVIPCATWKMKSKMIIKPEKVGSIVFLEKGCPGVFSRVSSKYAVHRILRERQLIKYQTVLPGDRKKIRKSVISICSSFPAYILRYSNSNNLIKLLRLHD